MLQFSLLRSLASSRPGIEWSEVTDAIASGTLKIDATATTLVEAPGGRLRDVNALQFLLEQAPSFANLVRTCDLERAKKLSAQVALLAEALAQQGCELDSLAQRQEYLQKALQLGCKELAKRSLSSGQFTWALLHASQSFNAELIEFLLQHKADPNGADDKGCKPLMFCLFPAGIRLLIEHGANPNNVNAASEPVTEVWRRRRLPKKLQRALVAALRSDGCPDIEKLLMHSPLAQLRKTLRQRPSILSDPIQAEQLGKFFIHALSTACLTACALPELSKRFSLLISEVDLPEGSGHQRLKQLYRWCHLLYPSDFPPPLGKWRFSPSGPREELLALGSCEEIPLSQRKAIADLVLMDWSMQPQATKYASRWMEEIDPFYQGPLCLFQAPISPIAALTFERFCRHVFPQSPAPTLGRQWADLALQILPRFSARSQNIRGILPQVEDPHENVGGPIAHLLCALWKKGLRPDFSIPATREALAMLDNCLSDEPLQDKHAVLATLHEEALGQMASLGAAISKARL